MDNQTAFQTPLILATIRAFEAVAICCKDLSFVTHFLKLKMSEPESGHTVQRTQPDYLQHTFESQQGPLFEGQLPTGISTMHFSATGGTTADLQTPPALQSHYPQDSTNQNLAAFEVSYYPYDGQNPARTIFKGGPASTPGTHRGPARIVHYGTPQYANGVLQSATDETIWEYANPQPRSQALGSSNLPNPVSTNSPDQGSGPNPGATPRFSHPSFDPFSDAQAIPTGDDQGQGQGRYAGRTFQPGYAETLADNSSIKEVPTQGYSGDTTSQGGVGGSSEQPESSTGGNEGREFDTANIVASDHENKDTEEQGAGAQDKVSLSHQSVVNRSNKSQIFRP
ncbi:MAG: hypothetical protein M1831_001121 [Alyxoria varia]|nr:MAG: hypothetical protein M1831_001121 [Alyxoria varia]